MKWNLYSNRLKNKRGQLLPLFSIDILRNHVDPLENILRMTSSTKVSPLIIFPSYTTTNLDLIA